MEEQQGGESLVSADYAWSMSKSGVSSTLRMLMLANRLGLPKWLISIGGRAQAFWLRHVGGRGPLSADLLVLTTRGRVSGKQRSTSLLYFDRGPRRYVVASFAGSDHPPAWYLNLVADPHVTVELNGKRSDALARELEQDEADALWPTLDAIFPPFVEYRERTSRRIPVIEIVAD
jgi:deazaflavin-dependent oxidoreductase (nitroreductase family)